MTRYSLCVINPEGFAVRVAEFEDTCGELNTLLLRENIDQNLFGNVSKLKEKLGGFEGVPTLEEYAYMAQVNVETGDYGETYQGIQATYEAVNEKIVRREWQFPHELTDPHQLASGLLIEGYGVSLERLIGDPTVSRDFVLAFEEVLLTRFPDSRLLHDVVGWMKEERQDFSPGIGDLLDGFADVQQEYPMVEVAAYLNAQFKKGVPAHRVLESIQKFPRPIAVDWNNVIANNITPLELNPDAPRFLKSLRQIGNVVIVTTAEEWDEVYSFFKDHGIWSADMVIMTVPVYEFLSEMHDTNAQEVIETYLNKNKLSIDYRDLISPAGFKRIAPLFNKSFPIPLVDNSFSATHENPGMFGIHVQGWGDIYKDLNYRSKSAVTLPEAVEKVRAHYGGL